MRLSGFQILQRPLVGVRQRLFRGIRPDFKVQGNTVSADFGKTDGIACFKLVREDGRYKIDNSLYISPAFREK